MTALSELEPQALSLTEKERAQLATTLLRSLPASFTEEDEEDEGLAEALRREAEGARDPAVLLTQEQFEKRVAIWMDR